MATVSSPLDVFYENWKVYQDKLAKALAPLTAEQLALRAAPNERTVGEIAQHMVGVRAGWFHYDLGEGGEEIAQFVTWDEDGAPEHSAAELVDGLNATWDFMAGLLSRWTPEDLAVIFSIEGGGQQFNLPRAWVVWHVLEHDLTHGGEISLTLGMHGLQAPRL